MINFDATIAAELQKEVVSAFFCLSLDLGATYRFTDAEYPVFDSSSNRYEPRTFLFNSLRSSGSLSVEQLDIEIDDTDALISTLVLNSDVRRRAASLYMGVIARESMVGIEWDSGITWDTGIVWSGDYTQYKTVMQLVWLGFIGGWTLEEDSKATLNLTNELIAWNKKTLRQCSASCQWVFKGTECGYTGAGSWCDKSYDRCRDLGQDDYYGGFRFLPNLMDKQIWWGRVAK